MGDKIKVLTEQEALDALRKVVIKAFSEFLRWKGRAHSAHLRDGRRPGSPTWKQDRAAHPHSRAGRLAQCARTRLRSLMRTPRPLPQVPACWREPSATA
jgi:hypothetical protein